MLLADAAEVGSYVAVGTFHPSIEIWNLDVIDALEPNAVLGGFEDNTGVTGGKKPKKGKKGRKASHCLRVFMCVCACAYQCMSRLVFFVHLLDFSYLHGQPFAACGVTGHSCFVC